MENPAIDSEIKKNGLISGLILGGALFVLSIFAFYFITSMTTSMLMIILGPLIFSVVIPLVLAVFLSLDMRKKIGGYWVLKQATTGIFIMFMVSYLLSAALNWTYVKVIEPDMVGKMQTAMVNATASMLEKSGADQAKIDKQTADIEKKFEDQKNITIGKTLQSGLITTILLFVVSLVFGAIMKKEPPLFDVIDEEPSL
jgi:hypothetical protein